MKKTLENITKVLIYASFFVPLVVIPSSFIFPFIVPKILLFRSLTALMLGCYILLLFINWQEYKPKFTPINLVLGFFVLSFAISTFVGVDPYHSFWDNHERMLGLFTILHYFIFYLVCTSIFKNWSEWKVVLKIFLLGGSIVMLLGMIQKVDPNFLMNQGGERVASTLGNAIYVGGYGLFLLFVSALLFIKEKDNLWRWVWAGLGLLGFVGLIFSGTRGSMLGLLAGGFFALCGYIFYLKEYPVARKISIGVMITAILVLGILFLNRQNQLVIKIPVLGRLLNSSLSTGTGITRLIAWNIAVESWKERPVFGWGPNNFFYAFNKYYSPKSLEYGYSETWFDNAHNIILNTLTVQGLFGLLCYLSIFIIAIVTIWQNKELKQKNIHLVVLGSAFLVAHLVQNITVFENPTSYLYFIFWLAMLNKFSQMREIIKEPSVQQSAAPDKKIGIGIVSIITIVVLLIIIISNIQPARANMKTLNALNQIYRDPVLGLAYAKETLDFNSPHIDDIRSDLSRTALQVLNTEYQKMGKDKSTEFLQLFYSNLQKNLVLHPFDIRNQLALAQIAQLGWVITQDNQYIYDADKYLTQALEYSPHRQQVIYMLSFFKLQEGQINASIKMIQQSIDDDPKIAEGYWRLAYAYLFVNQKDKAQEVISMAKQKGIVFDAQGQKVVDMVMAPDAPQINKKK